MVIAYGCCIGTWAKFASYVMPVIGESRVIALENQTCIAVAYNAIIATQESDVDALVLLHDDLEITDPAFEVKIKFILETVPDVALVGVAGGRGIRSLDWWEYETVGHQLTDSGMLDFGPRTGLVDDLEGSLLVLSRWAIENLRFDESYGGFHGYDDIGMHANAAGKAVVVADIDTHHHTGVGFRSPQSAAEWERANERFKRKWGL